MENTDKLPQDNEELKLVESFQQEYYGKFGYYPAVIVKGRVISKENTIVMNLPELQACFRKFLPKSFGNLLTLESKNRKRELVDLRFIYFKIARTMGYHLTRIGLSVNRDHTTVIYGLEQFDNMYETNDSFRQKYHSIINYIKTKYEPSIMDHPYKMESKS